MAHQGVIEVLLTDAEEWPKHSTALPVDVKGWPKWRGKPIRIVAIPETPNSTWTCDSVCVFRVAPESLQAIGGKKIRDLPVYVCSHQIRFKEVRQR